MTTPETLTHAMATRSRKKLIEAAVVPGGIMSYLAAANRINFEDGGPSITNPLLIGDNPNVGTATYYDSVAVDETNELTTVSYSMTRLVGTLIMSDQEADENSGDAVIVKILSAKLTALETSIKKYQRTRMASLTSGADQNGLHNVIPADPTTGTVGGINLATELLFRSSSYDFASGLNQGNIEEAFDDILLDLTHDGESPTVIFVGRNIFRMHRAAARDKSQISLRDTGFGKALINLGVKGTSHQGIALIYDEQLGEDEFFIVNEEHINIHILKTANMKMKKLTAPWNVDAVGRRFIMESQLCSWKNYRTHAYGTN